MRHGRQELKVYYDGPEIDAELDEALEKALDPFGYERWASGYDLVNDKRDLAFDRPIGAKRALPS